MFISNEIYLVIVYSPLAVTNPVAHFTRGPLVTSVDPIPPTKNKHSNRQRWSLSTLAEFSEEKLAIVFVIFFAYIALGLTNYLR